MMDVDVDLQIRGCAVRQLRQMMIRALQLLIGSFGGVKVAVFWDGIKLN